MTMTRRELKLAEEGRSVIRLQEICWKGHEAEDLIGVRGGMVGWCVRFVLLANSTAFNIFADVRSKTGPPKLGGN